MARDDDETAGPTKPPAIRDAGISDRTERADGATRRVPTKVLRELVAETRDRDDDDVGPTRQVAPLRRPGAPSTVAPERAPPPPKPAPDSLRPSAKIAAATIAADAPSRRAPAPSDEADTIPPFRRELAAKRLDTVDAPTQSFGRFTLLGLVGRGGMAEVRLAAEARPDKSVGLCVLKRVMPGAPREYVDALVEEGRISKRLRHPNIVELFDAGEIAGQVYLAFELLDGVSLRELLRILGPARLPLSAVLEIGVQAADALAHAHGAVDERGAPLRVVHRDVTPQNVLVERTGRVKLVDFGIARFSDRGQATRHGQIKGKLGYLAPEQLRGGAVDGRTDVFSLGLVLAELIAKKPLLPKVLMVVADLEPALRALMSEAGQPVPPIVTAFLARMVSAPMEARPTAAEVARELRRIAALVPPSTTLAELVHRSVFPHLVPFDLGSVVEGRTTRVAVTPPSAGDDDDDDYATTIRVARVGPPRK